MQDTKYEGLHNRAKNSPAGGSFHKGFLSWETHSGVTSFAVTMFAHSGEKYKCFEYNVLPLNFTYLQTVVRCQIVNARVTVANW